MDWFSPWNYMVLGADQQIDEIDHETIVNVISKHYLGTYT
jgi:hypothetical protein